MKTSQYVRQENAIAAADAGGIRERWMWGLRLLRDPDAFTPGSTQLKPGRAEELARAARAHGRSLSEREIRRRLQCARAYQTEAEFGRAVAEFETWRELSDANFPSFDVDPDEPLADHRTDAERKRDRARALADVLGEQGALFPLDDFEPSSTELKELVEYASEMAELTARFARRDQRRMEYLDRLVEAAGGDLSTTWQDAHDRAFPEPVLGGAA
jgi:hypothetical protein